MDKPERHWLRACGTGLLLGMLVLMLIEVIHTAQGPTSFYERKSYQIREVDGKFVATGTADVPDGASFCDLEFEITTWVWYGNSFDSQATGDCLTGELDWDPEEVESATFDPDTGEWDIVFNGDPGNPDVVEILEGEFAFKLGLLSLAILYLFLNVVGLIAIGIRYHPLPAAVIALPAILLPIGLSIFFRVGIFS